MARRILALALLATLAAPGCSFFREQTPDDSCINDQDCFRGAGEACLRDFDGGPGTCGIPIDAAIYDAPPPTPDATPVIDAPRLPDAGPAIDGTAVDAGGRIGKQCLCTIDPWVE